MAITRVKITNYRGIAAIESHMQAYPDAYKDDKSHIDRMRLIDYREETLREISRYATRFAAATGKL